MKRPHNKGEFKMPIARYLTALVVGFAVQLPSLGYSQQAETWVGWVETPKQHLRTVVNLQRATESGRDADSGTLVSPDQSSEAISLTEVRFQSEQSGGWRFALTNPKDGSRIATYLGTQVASDRVEGQLEQQGQMLKLDLLRIDALPSEPSETLGADAVWTGTLNLVFKKMDFRIRVYSNPPFASPTAPRVLFDSLSERVVGIPATVQMDSDRMTTFDIGAIGAKFTAKLNDAGNELEGSFIQNKVPLPLTMALVEIQKPGMTVPEMTVPETASVPAGAEFDPEPGTQSTGVREMKSTTFFREVPFEVLLGGGKQATKAEVAKGASSSKEQKIAGTLTIPKMANPNSKGFPAVVMVTGSGPQDRDETIGRHKPFAVLAHFLAEQGIASLRYDDRGVEESTGDFLNATTADFAKDALAVWKHASELKEIDSERIGILGHSEGGLIGPMVANWESKVAFLILLAPPGLSGGEVLKTQIDRMAELQGVSQDVRRVTMVLQQRLQDIASGYFVDEATMKRDIRKVINEQWGDLEFAALASAPATNVIELKQQLIDQIEVQFQELKRPWYSYFLTYDPSPAWMLLRCPTLAIWGENDVQVLPGPNRKAIEQMVQRNSGLDITLVVLPAINHMMQTSLTGLPDEYDSIDETIAAPVLDSIKQWLNIQDLRLQSNVE